MYLYLTDWSFLRLKEGKKPNWVHVFPGSGPQIEAANPTAVLGDSLFTTSGRQNRSKLRSYVPVFRNELESGDQYALRS